MADEIYIDATFKYSPKGFYQTLNIISLNKTTKFHLPVFFIPMSNKSYISYRMIFSTIKEIMLNHKLGFINENIIIMADFEYGLRKAIKEIFPNFSLKGCYFHYIKNIWVKAKKLGLCRKKYIEKTRLIIFALKIITFIKSDNIDNFFTQLKNYINHYNEEEKKLLNKFLKYFSNTWLKTKFIHFDLTFSGNMTSRTNNLCEAFHNSLSYSIEHANPKMAIFVENMIKIVKTYFNKSINNLVNINNSQPNNNNSYNLVYNFINEYHKTYKLNIDFEGISQLDGEFKYKMDSINIQILKALFGLRLKENVDEEKYKNDISQYDFDEIDNILPGKDEKDNINLNKNKKDEFINLIDMDYKKSFKRSYNDLTRFNELYDIKFSENLINNKMNISPKLKLI